jgi:small-conductance mechanosensitive channel
MNVIDVNFFVVFYKEMCYNKEVSLVIFIFGIMTAIKLIRKDKVKEGVIVIFVSIMQLVEFFLHMYPNINSSVHQIASLSIFFVSMSQIICYMALVPYQIKNKENKEINTALLTLGSIYLAISVYFLFTVLFPNYGKFESIIDPICKSNCRLNWAIIKYIRNENIYLYYLMSIIYVLVTCMIIYQVFGINIMIAILSLWIFCVIFFSNNSVGTMWCFLSIFAICAIILYE